jgi:hypothetical protein
MKTWIITIIVGMAIICAGPLLDGTGGVNQQKEWTK